ncbi:MAG: polymer-forming cytoskeletal protein [Acidobacteria bacterium]|nr:polymer-forming cytoskeletal protein [Acidobacteriota bacterium]
MTLLLFAAAADTHAQNSTAPAPVENETPRVYRTTGSRVAVGRSIQVASDEEVSDAVVVIGGSLRVDGRVRDGLVVVGGNLELGPRADVRGDVVLVGGRLTRDPNARVRGSVSDISFGDWSTWVIGGLHLPVVDFGDFGRWLSLMGTVVRVALLGLLMALVILVARAPVARVGRAAAAQPGRAFALGLITELLFVPAVIIGSVGLIVTIIGIPLVAVLVPLAFLACFVALLLGFTALACRIGEWAEDRLGWRAHSALLATSIGLLLILAPTMLSRMIGVASEPLRFAALWLLMAGVVLEFVIWTMGLGAAMMTGFGRWSTVPPPVPPIAHPGVAVLTS